MDDRQPDGGYPRLRLVHSVPPEPVHLLDDFVVCGTCGTYLERQREMYVCDGCGAARAAAAPLEEKVAAQVLTLMSQAQGWTRLVTVGAAEGEQPPTELLAQWWNTVGVDGQRVLLDILVEYVQVKYIQAHPTCISGRGRFVWSTHPRTG
ncbi:hypothetical protein [Planobispora takensis]|uniref:Uncharacterized protein n=1 Tax=Planobispora takensis TaxID=1367882 RepID=A0A8J3T2A4_9ACTN|nr:hypothetical protein [Planobispora takensis]GII03590.1 hypothetical protein Pta02_55980 [Planobispora takensis]